MARENGLWGEERIASELLLKLGIRISPRTVRKYLPKRPPGRARGDLRWSTFLKSHARGILACDFFMSAVDDRPRELTVVSRHDGRYAAVVVEVRDVGPGLEPARMESVFEPFYTTKAEGIGIGLSISRSIIEAHGGRLWAQPNTPHGAIFRFSLPAEEVAA